MLIMSSPFCNAQGVHGPNMAVINIIISVERVSEFCQDIEIQM